MKSKTLGHCNVEEERNGKGFAVKEEIELFRCINYKCGVSKKKKKIYRFNDLQINYFAKELSRKRNL